MADILFDPILEKKKRPRYSFESDNLTVSITPACDCDKCLTYSSDDETRPIWVIIDKLRGRYDPIAFCDDIDQAEKIVNALNATSG